MARKLVEYADVARAAQALKDAGKKPTIVGVRELLDSKGSYTTISTYLKRWAEENTLEQSPPEVELPQAIIDDGNVFLKRLYLAAQTAATERLQHERDHEQERAGVEGRSLSKAIEMANNDTERADLLEEQLENLNRQYAETGAALTSPIKLCHSRQLSWNTLWLTAQNSKVEWQNWRPNWVKNQSPSSVTRTSWNRPRVKSAP